MVLRTESIEQRLVKLEESVSNLETLNTLTHVELMTSFRDMWAVERGLQLSAEIMFDVGNHILSAEYGVAADDYEDILQQLMTRHVIAPELYERLKGLGGFRNILVHGYLRLDPEYVIHALRKAPRDFSEFAVSIRRWCERQNNQNNSSKPM